MTDNHLTHLYFLLDRSGSMHEIARQTREGFDDFIAEQRNAPGTCRVTLAQFDDEYLEVYADRPIADVPPLSLEPRSTTALLDSLGRLLTDAKARIDALTEADRPGTVLVGVMTDGMENASREWTHAAVKSLIEERSRADWQFLYLGADQDAIEEGAKMGFARQSSMTYSRGSTKAAIDAMSKKTTDYRRARHAGRSAAESATLTHFTDEDRARAVED